MPRPVALILFASLAASCASPRSAAEPPLAAAERTALNQLRDDFATAFNAGDAARVASIYAGDAVLMPPNEPAVAGREAIQAWFKAGFDQYDMKATLSSQEFAVLGPEWAFDRGAYTMTLVPRAGGKAIEASYKYLTLLHKEAAGWKAKRDIYNSNAPGM